MHSLRHCAAVLVAVLLANPGLIFADNSVSAPTPPILPDATTSAFRMMGGLVVVLGLFFGGVWAVRNLPFLTKMQGPAPQLRVLEARPLGGRHTLYVVGYRQQRFLLASSTNGISLVSALPDASAEDAPTTPNGSASFAAALQNVLHKS